MVVDIQTIWIESNRGLSISEFEDGTMQLSMIIGSKKSWVVCHTGAKKFASKELLGQYLIELLSLCSPLDED